MGRSEARRLQRQMRKHMAKSLGKSQREIDQSKETLAAIACYTRVRETAFCPCNGRHVADFARLIQSDEYEATLMLSYLANLAEAQAGSR